MPPKHFDIILIGATGFTGKRAAQYLFDHAPDTLTWGIAARNESKLSQLAKKLDISPNRCFIADTTNRSQVEAIVQQTNIIITTAGPFSLYGEEVIAACSKFGTHYLDITGEVGFIKKMKDAYENEAQKSGAVLIPFSGFDSVPAELAAFLISKNFDTPKKLSIQSHYSISGGFNGGTIATMLNKFESGEYKEMNDPKLLIENSGQQIHSPDGAHFFGYNKNIKRWSVPFIMGTINSKVVYRTAADMAELDQKYADSISYSEHLSLGKWYNPIPFFFVSLVLISLAAFGPYKWFRNIVKKVTPAPGEGPTEEQIEQGFFKLLATGKDEQGSSVSLKISYPGDPGNKATVFFLCETALFLAESNPLQTEYSGFLSPVTVFGNTLVDRLKSKGLMIEISKK